MNILFYITAVVALFATVMVCCVQNAVHALLYMVISLLAVAVIFFMMGAPFVGALEIIVYAGAIMVLFIFVVMLLNIGPKDQDVVDYKSSQAFVLPSVLFVVLLVELLYLLRSGEKVVLISGAIVTTPQMIGKQLFTTYSLSLEMASLLLMGGLIAAYHIGRKQVGEKKEERHE